MPENFCLIRKMDSNGFWNWFIIEMFPGVLLAHLVNFTLTQLSAPGSPKTNRRRLDYVYLFTVNFCQKHEVGVIKCSYHANVTSADPCMTYFVLSPFPICSCVFQHSATFHGFSGCYTLGRLSENRTKPTTCWH